MKRILSGVALLCAGAALALLWGATSAYASGGCPVGMSTMGCSVPQKVGGTLGALPPVGESIPDVSDWQGTVNWPLVKGWELSHGWKLTGGIFKLGETAVDPYAASNAAALHHLGMVAIGYWFIRPIKAGAAFEANQIVAEAKATGIRVVVLDEEVAGIQGYAAVIAPVLEHAGFKVVDYHSAGNVLDTTATGLPCWVADYGPTTPPVCTTGKRIAWQWTQTGAVPGVTGFVDESITYGLLKLAVPPKRHKPVPPKRTVCWKPTGSLVSPQPAKCRPIVTHERWLISRRDFWRGEFQTCIRYAEGIRCGYAQHWEIRRAEQAIKFRRRYS